jgi:hypothetical protein
MQSYSQNHLVRLTRRQFFALHAEVVTELAALPEGSTDWHIAMANLRLIRRALAKPALTP